MKEAGIQVIIYKPDPDNPRPEDQKGVVINPRLQKRFNQFVPIGVFIEGSNLKYYFFEQCDNSPKIYDNLEDLKKDLPTGLESIFNSEPKLFFMGHGNGGYYGLGNCHGPSEQLYDENFDLLLSEFKDALAEGHGELLVTLEGCNTDNQLGAKLMQQDKTFLERVSINHPDITFSGTGPWNPQDGETGIRSLSPSVPATSMAGNVWKPGNSVIFFHEGTQIALRKSLFSSTDTAKRMKANTLAFARAVLGEDVNLQKIEEISLSRDILTIEDLKKMDGFREHPVRQDVAAAFIDFESQILEEEKNTYLKEVRRILAKVESQDPLTDRDILKLTLGLKEPSIFAGHEVLRDAILSNESLRTLMMVSCGKVLIGGPSNDALIDLLLAHGTDINSQDDKGMTALHYASQNFYNYREEPIHLVNKLITSGANLDAQNNEGDTPKDIAKKHGEDARVVGIDKLLTCFHHEPPRLNPEEVPQEVRSIFLMSAHKASELLSLPEGKREYTKCGEGTLHLPEDAVDKLQTLLEQLDGNLEQIASFESELDIVITSLVEGHNTGEILHNDTDEIAGKCFKNAEEQLAPVTATLRTMKEEFTSKVSEEDTAAKMVVRK